MADPTRAEIFANIANIADTFEGLDDAFAVFVSDLDTITQAMEGDYSAETLAALEGIRATLASVMTPAAIRSVFLPQLRELAKQMDIAATEPQAMWDEIYDTLQAASETVKEREISFDTSAAAGGSNAGTDVTILRLTDDANGHPLQAVHIDGTKTAKVVQDQTTGAVEHEELIELRGDNAEKDFLQVVGSGQGNRVFVNAISARTSANLLSNPSFSEYTGSTGSGNMTALTDWTVTGTITSTLEANTATTYRDFLGDTTPTSLLFVADEVVTQVLKDTRNVALDPATPYWLQVAVFPTTGTSAGNIILTMGSVTRTVALTSLTANQWNTVGILAAPGQNCWPENFVGADTSIAIEIASLSGGTGVYVDDVLFAPGTRFDNTWWWPVPLASASGYVPWKLDDTLTWSSDSLSTQAEIQYWAGFRTGWGHWPSTTGVETYGDV